ncbi:MAG: 30S ribosomal protein S8 [Candidatus Hadarchaeales archaeon]
MDPIADALSKILNSEVARKRTLEVSTSQKLLLEILVLMKTEGYISNYETVDGPHGKALRIELNGRINRCGAIKPRYSVRNDEYEKWEKRYLPASGIGMLVVSTSRGIMNHRKAREMGLGGKLLAYVY